MNITKAKKNIYVVYVSANLRLKFVKNAIKVLLIKSGMLLVKVFILIVWFV